MKHIVPFPFPTGTDENAADREALRMKLLAGRIILNNAVHGTFGPNPPPRWQTFPCWHYAGKWEDGKGYKKVKYKGFTLYVHRVSVELFKGPIPDGHVVDHHCKNHGCWQPEHLEPVLTKVNIERGDNLNWMMRTAAKQQIAEAFGVPADKRALIAADLAEIEKRVLTHYFHNLDYAQKPVRWPPAYEVRGKIGDQDVVVETTRPDFWSTPSLIQAHIDHGHPRFRAPMERVVYRSPWVEQEPAPGCFPAKERLVIVEGALATPRLTDIPDDHVIVPPNVNLIDFAPYTFPDAPVVPVHDAAFDDSELARRRFFDLLPVVRAWWRRLFPRPIPGTKTTRSVGEL